MEDELKYLIALTNIRGIGSMKAKLLMETFGSAQGVFEAEEKTLLSLAGVGQCIIEQRRNPALMERAIRESQFIKDHHIQVLIHGQEGYPQRLKDCPDAPAALFFLGNANLESKHIISIVGTRSATHYGREMVEELIAGLKESVPDLIIVSGLALGIDVTAHKSALFNDIPTVGVVAHGLDRIYPAVHRNIASQMIANGGGIITEYCTGTEPERGNFIARNRIIAGLSDAVVIAESKDKGGSLVTASIALDYNREVLAFPGRAKDDRSQGCNRLIRQNRAGLITGAEDLLEALGWEKRSSSRQGIQQSIPFAEEHLSPTARLIIDALRERGDLRLSQLADITNQDHSTLLEVLLDLEMDGKIHTSPGGLYQLQ